LIEVITFQLPEKMTREELIKLWGDHWQVEKHQGTDSKELHLRCWCWSRRWCLSLEVSGSGWWMAWSGLASIG